MGAASHTPASLPGNCPRVLRLWTLPQSAATFEPMSALTTRPLATPSMHRQQDNIEPPETQNFRAPQKILLQHHTIPFHRAEPFIPSFLHSFIPSFLHSFIPSFLHSFIPSFLHSFIPSFLHSFIPSFLHSFIPSFLHSFIPSFLHSFIPSFLHSFIPSFLHSFIPSFDRAILKFASRLGPSVAGVHRRRHTLA